MQKTLQMGMGEAFERLMNLQALAIAGIASDEQLAERRMILQSLNETKLNMGFDCDLDGVPDTVAIFAQSVKTSCCRIMPTDDEQEAPVRRSYVSSRRRN